MFIAEFDQGRGFELALRGHDQRARLQLVQVRHDQHQVGRLLDGEEARARHIDANCVLKVFNCRSRSSLELNDVCALV